VLRIRPYKTKDAESIQTWIRTKEEHALWCANLIDFPLTEERMEVMRHEYNQHGEGGMYTALNTEGVPVGFFAVMRADYKTNNAHLGFIVVAPELRGHGYGKEIVHKAVHYCFCILSMSSVTLKVYDVNKAAYYCYQAVGFVDVTHNDRTLVFEGESWGSKDMIIKRSKYTRKGECL